MQYLFRLCLCGDRPTNLSQSLSSTVCRFTTEYLWHVRGRDISYCCPWYVFIWMQSAAAAVAAALCVAMLMLLRQQCCCFLLLFVIVCRMTKYIAGSLNLIPVFSLISS